LAQQSLVLGGELEGDGGQFGGKPLEFGDLVRRGVEIVLGDLEKVCIRQTTKAFGCSFAWRW
jgi:hypothetical protein